MAKAKANKKKLPSVQGAAAVVKKPELKVDRKKQPKKKLKDKNDHKNYMQKAVLIKAAFFLMLCVQIVKP